MIANCKQARHGEEIGDYNKEKKVNGVHVATEIFGTMSLALMRKSV